MLAPEDVSPLLEGGCFCGEIRFAIFGRPKLRAYCHCTDCQRLMGKPRCPFVHTTHFKENDFVWTRPDGSSTGSGAFDHYENPSRPHKRRFRCKECGTPVASFNTRTGQYSVWVATLDRGPDGEIVGWELVKPTAHQFYGTRMLDVNDGLGKWEGYEEKSERIG